MNKFILILMTLLAGCSGAREQVRKQVTSDLAIILRNGNCETTCEALKFYAARNWGALADK